MTAATLTLTDFLIARIAEDERAAWAVPSMETRWETFSDRFDSWESDHSTADRAFVNRFDPARVLAECESKRRIIGFAPNEDHLVSGGWDSDDDVLETNPEWDMWQQVLQMLALPYASHPDFRDEWRP